MDWIFPATSTEKGLFFFFFFSFPIVEKIGSKKKLNTGPKGNVFAMGPMPTSSF